MNLFIVIASYQFLTIMPIHRHHFKARLIKLFLVLFFLVLVLISFIFLFASFLSYVVVILFTFI